MARKSPQLPPPAPPDPYEERGRELNGYLMSELVFGADGLNPEPHLEALRSGAYRLDISLWD